MILATAAVTHTVCVILANAPFTHAVCVILANAAFTHGCDCRKLVVTRTGGPPYPSCQTADESHIPCGVGQDAKRFG